MDRLTPASHPRRPGQSLRPELVARAARVLLINNDPSAWNVQRRYTAGGSNSWRPVARRMADNDLEAMLLQRWWLGCRVPTDGQTDRLAFDLDCKGGPAGRAPQEAIYWQLRDVMGADRVPLVFRTPSGDGLRVIYRIPWQPLANIVTSVSGGLAADACRLAKLEVRSGQLEIFPQRTKIDRVPLGRAMPFVHPDTLAPIPTASIGNRFDASVLEGALVEMERWHERPYADLVPHLQARVREGETVASGARRAPGTSSAASGSPSSEAAPITRRGVVSPDVRHLVGNGLTAPSTRYWAEYRVGLAILAEPTIVGLTGTLTDAHVAAAIAGWLATHHNGHSREWRDSVRRRGSVAQATAWWAQCYLLRDRVTGLHMIDRLDATLAKSSPLLRRTNLLAPAERDALMALAAETYPPGTQRYRAECWLVAWQRATRSIVAHHARRDNAISRALAAKAPTLEVEICSRWMRAWPFGEGKAAASGMPRYAEYRALLERAGLSQLVRAAPVHARLANGAGKGRDLRHEAHRYRVARPSLMVRVRDAGADMTGLAAVRTHLPRQYGRAPTEDEVHHALALTRRGIDLRARYGQRTEAWVTALAREAEARLGTAA